MYFERTWVVIDKLLIFIKRLTDPRAIKTIFTFYLLYVFITGIFIFSKPKNVSKSYQVNSSVDNFYSKEVGPDRTILLNNPLHSGLARIKIIESAKESLDISYFSIEEGETPDLFFGALLEAADRGVQINILLDGIFHGMKKNLRDVIHVFAYHPNVHLKFYEPLNVFKPWTLNNRLHDKYIIADGKILIIGGRNIGDKYFAPEWYHDKITHDRDIVIINTDDNNSNSVLYQISDYFNLIWNHKYTKPTQKKPSIIRSKKALKKGNDLKRKSKIAKKENLHLFEGDLDLMSISSPTNKITLIHNPIERFSKEPWLWYEISELIKSSKKSVFIQSPYIVPTKEIISSFVNKKQFSDVQISMLTNSLFSTPNPPAYSGYINHRKNLVDLGIDIYEIQSQDSIHAKSFVIDEDLLLIGSFNLDSRSSNLSTESMVVIHSSQAVEKFKDGIQEYIDQSLLVSKDYNYILKDGIEEKKVSFIKKTLISTLSHVTKWFEFLL